MSRNSDEDMLYWQVGLALAHIVGVSRKRIGLYQKHMQYYSYLAGLMFR